MESSSHEAMLPLYTRSTQESSSDHVVKAEESPRVYDLYSWSIKSPHTRLVYIQDVNTTNVAISQLDAKVLGFDLEWKPNFIKGNPENPVALVQLACDNFILLIHLAFMDTFPEKLRELLADPSVVKAGVGIQKDARKLFYDHDVDVRNCVDLSLLARTVDNNRWKGKYANPIGLARLCETYEELTLSKGRVQTSNWERFLDSRQREYAANDSHVGLVLYNRLAAMATTKVPVPDRVWYSFDAIRGLLFQPSTGVMWHPFNPYYDPGPPPPPRPPKAEGGQITSRGHHKTFRGGHFRHNRPERPLSPAAPAFVPGAQEHSPSPSPVPRIAPNTVLSGTPQSSFPTANEGFVSFPAFVVDRGDYFRAPPIWSQQPGSISIHGAGPSGGYAHGHSNRGKGRGRGWHAVAAQSG